MPFDHQQYDGIFAFALLHLLDEQTREQFIAACYAQLKPGGAMVFITIADTAPMFGTGTKIGDRLYETMPGVRFFFYDESSIQAEFRAFELVSVRRVTEPATHTSSQNPGLDFLCIACEKPN